MPQEELGQKKSLNTKEVSTSGYPVDPEKLRQNSTLYPLVEVNVNSYAAFNSWIFFNILS